MNTAIRDLLFKQAAAWGIDLDGRALHRFGAYLKLLEEWNRSINLTAIHGAEQVAELHFLDSLAPVGLLRDATSLIDVGAGAGFPGAVLAIALPTLRVTAIDGVAKKVAFLNALRRALALDNFEAQHLRDEAMPRRFAAAISRATWEPSVWVARARRLVEPGGLIIAMETDDAPAFVAPEGLQAIEPYRYQIGEVRRKLAPFRVATG